LEDSTQPGRVKVGAATGTANEPHRPGAPTKPEKAAFATEIQHAASQTESALAATQQAAKPAAKISTGWSVQLAAPKSGAEAKSAVERLNAKFASDLNGAPIGVYKAAVNGETIYRLRVVGLSKADAAALCARLKADGGECFIAK
jgi:cell division septation protein DedD